jgi:hypothetical protein
MLDNVGHSEQSSGRTEFAHDSHYLTLDDIPR